MNTIKRKRLRLLYILMQMLLRILYLDYAQRLGNICTDLGLGMETIARRNLDKLNSRMARGVIKGSGDNR